MEKSNQVRQDNTNLSIYDSVREVPKEAKNEIEAIVYSGNKLIANEKKYENGQQVYIPYLDDDAYKKAYTDAISVAAKALGVGADVYFEKDKGKYASDVKPSQEQTQQAPSKPVLSSKGRDWKAAVAFTASQSDSAEVISEKIRSKSRNLNTYRYGIQSYTPGHSRGVAG